MTAKNTDSVTISASALAPLLQVVGMAGQLAAVLIACGKAGVQAVVDALRPPQEPYQETVEDGRVDPATGRLLHIIRVVQVPTTTAELAGALINAGLADEYREWLAGEWEADPLPWSWAELVKIGFPVRLYETAAQHAYESWQPGESSWRAQLAQFPAPLLDELLFYAIGTAKVDPASYQKYLGVLGALDAAGCSVARAADIFVTCLDVADETPQVLAVCTLARLENTTFDKSGAGAKIRELLGTLARHNAFGGRAYLDPRQTGKMINPDGLALLMAYERHVGPATLGGTA